MPSTLQAIVLPEAWCAIDAETLRVRDFSLA